MTADLNEELRIAVAAGRTASLERDGGPCRAASPEVEAKLSRLVSIAFGAFSAVMASIVVVGVTLF